MADSTHGLDDSASERRREFSGPPQLQFLKSNPFADDSKSAYVSNADPEFWSVPTLNSSSSRVPFRQIEDRQRQILDEFERLDKLKIQQAQIERLARFRKFGETDISSPKVDELQSQINHFCDDFRMSVMDAVFDFIENQASGDANRVAEPAEEWLDNFEDVDVSGDEASETEYSEDCLADVEKKIRDIMLEKRINQTQLAEMIGISPASISKVLKAPEKSKVMTLAKLARALDVDLSMFFRVATTRRS